MLKDTVYATVSTGDGEKLLTPLRPLPMRAAGPAAERTIVLDPQKTGQPMLGMGGTWTDTDVYNLLRMGEKGQDEVLRALFDPVDGAGWNFMRLPFGSTDWESTCDYYTYDDVPYGEKDWELANFSVQRDVDRGLFRLAKRCKAINPEVVFLGSVWGVPAWMKENNAIMYGRFDMACVDVYAKYLRMTVEAYAEQGVELLAVTTQNETLTADDRATPACRFTWRMQKEVIRALRREFREQGIGTEIWIYDHNFDMARWFVEPMLQDPEARDAFDAVAFHDYGGSPEEMGRLRDLYPDMPFYMTERYIGTVDTMDNLVQQLRNGARSYIQWTTMADEYRGPHQYVGRPFVYREPAPKEGRTFIYNLLDDADSWHKAPSYGLYGQFTKHLKRGMRYMDSTGGDPRWVTCAAFADPESGKVAAVVVNQTRDPQSFTLRLGGAQAEITQEPWSVAAYEVIPGELAAAGRCAVDEAAPPRFADEPAFDIEPQEILFSGELRAGREVALSCRVRNVGDAPTPERGTLMVQFFEDGDRPVARGTVVCPVLAPGGEAVVSCNVPHEGKMTWTAEGGYHNIFAYAAMGNCRLERNVANNRIGVEIYCAEA